MTGDEKKKRDPIFTVCFVVFILAAVSVVGVYVNEHYLTEDTTKAAYGDTVGVRYTGTFYAYYGEDNAVVFDTNVSSIAGDDAIIKSNSFKAGNNNVLEFKVGGDDVLTGFGNAVVGHKVGDKIQVTVENGYPAGSDFNTQAMSGLTIDEVQRMSVSEFESIYDYDLTAGSMTTITTVYGWPATAAYDATAEQVVITNMPVQGQTYTYVPGGVADDSEDDDAAEHSFGTTKFTVTGVNGGNIVCTIAFSDYTTVGSDGEIQMIELDFGTETWFVTNINGNEFTYKTCEETRNATLYFEIEIVSIE